MGTFEISDEAVEAAAKAVYGGDWIANPHKDAWLRDFRIALEAAAPYMLAGDAAPSMYGVTREALGVVPDALLEGLRSLHDQAQQGQAGHPSRLDAQREFCALASHIMTDYGVSAVRLGLALGLSASTVGAKFAKLGLKLPDVSLISYVGPIQPSRSTCAKGHPWTDANTGGSRGRRFCKTCRNERLKAQRRDPRG
jgi:hypothetical protein